MTQLVEDLLFLARSDAQSSEMPRAPLDVSDLLQGVVTELRSIADARQIRIRVATQDSAATISGNRPALRRLFLVLLDNALKYSRPGSDVALAISKHDSEVSVTIQDFGIGISPTDLPHIFKRFYQADRARADGGFGLGLSLAENIALAHGALIEAKSEEGSGSTFRVVFQAAESFFRRPSANFAEGIQRKLEILN